MKTIARHAAVHCMVRTGAARIIGLRHRGLGAIFTGHSVRPRNRLPYETGIHISAEFLEKALRFYRARDIDIISLDEVPNRLGAAKGKPFICFVFDDGYRDNLTVALPIFEKYGCPFTVYVTSHMVTRELDFWWGSLHEIISQADSIEHETLGRVAIKTERAKSRAYQSLCKYIQEAPGDAHATLADLSREYRVDGCKLLDDQALSERDLQTLGRHPLVTIGGHTTSHRALAGLPLEEARREVRHNLEFLRELTQQSVRHFAYPFGGPEACGPREFALLADEDVDTASTTRWGCLQREHVDHLTALPRMRLLGEYESTAALEFMRLGAMSAIRHGIRHNVITS